jgi:hypothetical protein
MKKLIFFLFTLGFLFLEAHYSIDIVPIYQNSCSFLKFVDSDNDNIDEIVETVNNIVYIRNLRGNIIRQLNFKCGVYFLAFTDIDFDNISEYVFSSNSNDTVKIISYTSSEGYSEIPIYVGKDMRKTGLEGYDGFISNITTYDINNDSYNDIVCFENTGFDLYPRGLIAYDLKNMKPLWEFNTASVFQEALSSLFFVLDVNNDSIDEIIWSTNSTCNGAKADSFDDFSSRLFAVNIKGDLQYTLKIGGHSTYSKTWVGDLESDGENDIVCVEERGLDEDKDPNSIYIIDAKNGRIKKYITCGEKFRGLEVADLERDGTQKIITGNTDGKLRVFDANLQLLQEKQFSSPLEVTDIGDIDNDGNVEIFGFTDNGTVYLLDKKLQILGSYQLEAGFLLTTKFVNDNKAKKAMIFYTDNKSCYYKILEFKRINYTSKQPPLIILSILGFTILGLITVLMNYFRKVTLMKTVFEETPILYSCLTSKGKIYFSKNQKSRRLSLKFLIENANIALNSKEERTFSLQLFEENYELRIIPYKKYFILLFTSPNTGNSEDILAWSGITQRLSHEIKNPLATVVLTLQRVKTLLSSDRNENTDTTIESHLDSTLEELERIRNTTNKFISVLSLSENIFEPVDLNIFIKRVLNSMQSVPEIIRFKFVFEENMPPVECDEKQIGSLFLTIIENSVEAITDSGTITIRTRLIERLNHLNSLSKFVEVQFEDTGCGIEKNILENIFKPYNSNKDNGSGIGLYLAKRIIDKHQGYINITSKINVGTIATILIPIKHEG